MTSPCLDGLIIFLLWMGDLVRENTLGGHFATLLYREKSLLKTSLVKFVKISTALLLYVSSERC